MLHLAPATMLALVSISAERDLIAQVSALGSSESFALQVPGTLKIEALVLLPEQRATTIKGYVRVMSPSKAALRALHRADRPRESPAGAEAAREERFGLWWTRVSAW